MPIIKCKMCGGDLNLVDDSTVCECEYCGTKQTVPKVDDEKKLKLFERANRLRTACEFDKAAGVYESIVADFDEEAEAYWGLILCKFGIEYVDDPATGNKVPTCHRSSFDSLMDDPNFDMVMECADPVARKVYREEAKQIEELRKRIIEVSAKEEPYDVFISYKELDDEGQRTLDSVIAQDIYAELTEKGYRVFFSRISLENKLGVEYEPYIFAALNSAKVILVVGTDYDYFNAVWVKNEWSRFLSLIAKGEKKTLIPVFKGIDAYDMPKEFRKLAAQDMGKVGAMQDLVRGVEKLLGKKGAVITNEKPVIVQQTGGPNANALLERGKMALEDEDWQKARELFDQILNMNPRDAEAYLGFVMAENKCRDRLSFQKAYTTPNSTIPQNRLVKRVRQFADQSLLTWLDDLDLKAVKATEEYERAEKEARLAKEKAEREAREAAEKEKRSLEEARKAQELHIQRIRERRAAAAVMVAAGDTHTVVLRPDGIPFATGANEDGQCDTSGWRNIVAVFAGSKHTIGLRADGTVIATGNNYSGQCNVENWSHIVSIAAGDLHTVGLRDNGTVVAIGTGRDSRCKVDLWRGVVDIAAGDQHTVGLLRDGTVKAVGNNASGQCNVSSWRGIVRVYAGSAHTVGLKADGTCVAVGDNTEGQCNVLGWKNIVAVSTEHRHTIGLKADGTVVATGYRDYGQCDVLGWTNIVAVYAGGLHTVGLRNDGVLLATGNDGKGQCKVNGFQLFTDFIDVEKQRAELIESANKMKQATAEKLNYEKAALLKEYASLSGVFANLHRSRIESRLNEIEKELQKYES